MDDLSFEKMVEYFNMKESPITEALDLWLSARNDTKLKSRETELLDDYKIRFIDRLGMELQNFLPGHHNTTREYMRSFVKLLEWKPEVFESLSEKEVDWICYKIVACVIYDRDPNVTYANYASKHHNFDTYKDLLFTTRNSLKTMATTGWLLKQFVHLCNEVHPQYSSSFECEIARRLNIDVSNPTLQIDEIESFAYCRVPKKFFNLWDYQDFHLNNYLRELSNNLSKSFGRDEMTLTYFELPDLISDDGDLDWIPWLTLRKERVVRGLVKYLEVHKFEPKGDDHSELREQILSEIKRIKEKLCPVLVDKIWLSPGQQELLTLFIPLLPKARYGMPDSVKAVMVGKEACRILPEIDESDSEYIRRNLATPSGATSSKRMRN